MTVRSGGRYRLGGGALLWIMGTAWVMLASEHLLALFVADDVLGVWVLNAVAWLSTVSVSIVCLLLAWERGTRFMVATAALAGVGVAAAIVAVDWSALYFNGFYRANRAEFAAVADLARRGEVKGGRLPRELQHLSLDGRAGTTSSYKDGVEDISGVFLMTHGRLVDGGIGYAYFTEDPDGVTFVCEADPCRVVHEVGDGWYVLS